MNKVVLKHFRYYATKPTYSLFTYYAKNISKTEQNSS